MLSSMTISTRESLGKRIRELRKANKLSQQKLALMTGVERSYLAKLEAGKRNPSIDCIEKIAGGLDITLSQLFQEVEDETACRHAQASELASKKTAHSYNSYSIEKL